MNKKKIIFGSVSLIVATMLATTAGLYYLLGLQEVKPFNFMRLVYALRVIDSHYVNEVDTEKLINGAVSGMVSSLDDPHSVYLDKEMYKSLMQHTEGSFGGIGIVLGMKDKELTVIAPIDGTPGAKSGIQSGDKIIKIDDKTTVDMTIEEAARSIRGEAGTKVTLVIRRNEAEQTYEITRSNIQTQTVAGKMLDDKIGYIQIASFSEHTGADLAKIYAELEQQGMQGVILDLRNNPGGVLQASVEVANFFIPKGVVVSTVDRSGHKEVLEATRLDAVKYPAVVLINEGSASASEIVAGAIKDTGSGSLVGTKSYGKGSVQAVLPMYENDALKMTIAKYYTPGGICIDGVGIEPDYNVELNQSGTDNQLEKAVDVLKEKL